MHYPPQPYAPFAQPVVKPPVVMWFQVYAGLMALLYLLMMAGGIVLAVLQPDLDEPGMSLFLGTLLSAGGLVACAVYVVGLFLPRKKWAWVYALILIAIGLGSITVVASAPLLVFWIQDKTKAWFGA